MADPILNLPELNEGDPLGYIRQNNRNLVSDWFAAGGKVTANNIAGPPGTVNRGEVWILSGSGTGQWAGYAVNTLVFALSDQPASAAGWHFLTPRYGMLVAVVAGSPTGRLWWNGTAWTVV
ncbi:MAG: DUF2793 domain-containing protein [Planctomycetota bacterium]